MLRIDEIVQQHGVSRTVARDVVKVLESLRVATSRRRVGVTVRPRREWNVFDPRMIRWRLDGARREGRLRSLSEPAPRRRAGRRRPRRHPRRRRAGRRPHRRRHRHGRHRPGGDLETYLGHDVDFHRTLLEASGNEMFAALAPVVAEVLSGRTHHHLMPAHPEPAAIQAHADVAAAVRAGDAATAERSMRAIVDEAQQAIEQAFPG
ncbi:GntR family transcriptional regulator [Angustibacter aerolatus]|uniref:GntR family transcriptional regulator n=1 Tax=Angustibacter aerolatus TaxID=1162965 RepID=A0ABQ6JID9_9ACTN|nr:FCD domain-containing protein [Angustibacter aerolatus]GMA86627.1 GntR family transcriptional regulator [Angustibacter aerolatus]